MAASLAALLSIETLAPFRRSGEVRDAIAAQVDGAIPASLRGEVVRTCPAVFETAGWRAQHWFDGLCMLYAFRIGSGGVDFRSRLLESEAARDAWEGKSRLGTFGTPTERPLWERIVKPVPRMTDNDNVNIARMGADLIAMTEGSRQLVIDDATLARVGPVRYPKDELDGAIMTAHPHFDLARGKVVNIATTFGAHGTLSVYEHGMATRQRDVIGAWRTTQVPYVHTFGLTPQHAILAAHPFAVKTVKMLWSNKGYVDHFDWHPQEGTRLVVIDRATGAVREHMTDPFFSFHTVNAFERGDETVLDLRAYPDAGIVTSSLRVARTAAQLPDLRPALVRIIMRPGVERAESERCSDAGFEFPSINYKRVSGQPYRYAYGAANGYEDGVYRSAIVKVDLETGVATTFSDGATIFGEPLFAARPGGEAEDEGVLLTVGSRQDADASVMAIIDAGTMTLAARASVPGAIPLGFHGSFVREAAPAMANVA